MWIFGYGSLIYRPSFEYVERRRAYVAGFARRFWQGSPDHRGTPDLPGRVVTLIARERDFCGGAAFRIDPSRKDGILAALDAREQAGFVRTNVPLFEGPDSATPFAEGITYVAGPDNPHFLGELDEASIADWIEQRHGPSGPNRDYALHLHSALRELCIDDDHVETITRRWRVAPSPSE